MQSLFARFVGQLEEARLCLAHEHHARMHAARGGHGRACGGPMSGQLPFALHAHSALLCILEPANVSNTGKASECKMLWRMRACELQELPCTLYPIPQTTCARPYCPAQADPRALSSSLWGLQELDAFPGEPALRALEREFAARLAGGRVPRRPVVIFVNSLAHFVRAVGWRPSAELLETAEAWIVASGGTLTHFTDDSWEARPGAGGPAQA